MLFEQIMFFIAAGFALGGALGVVLLRNPFFTVLSLVVHLIALAVLFLLLTAAFLAAAQVVVYAGAVMVLYLFVVSYVGGSDEPLRPDAGGFTGLLGPLFAVVLGIELTIAVVGSGLGALDTDGADLAAGFGSTRARSASCSSPASCCRSSSLPFSCCSRRSARWCWRASAAASSRMRTRRRLRCRIS